LRIIETRASGCVVNARVTLAAATGIVMAKDANMLAENGV